MAKILYILRHAKAKDAEAGETDFSRVLTNEGMKDASFMGKHAYEKGEKVDAILSSPAPRALLTAELAADQMQYNLNDIIQDEEIYNASTRTLLRAINNIDDKFDKVMLVGHNPSLTYISEYLTKYEVGNIKKAGLVRIDFEIDTWQAVFEGVGQYVFYDFPKKARNNL